MPKSNFWDVLSALAWPGVIGAIFFVYRSKLTMLIDAFVRKFEGASELKLGSIELKGPTIDPSADEAISPADRLLFNGNDYSRENATQKERDERKAQYLKTRALMLVHRIRPSRKKGQDFDISIFLVRKLSKKFVTARFNDVDYVEYYLGEWFGSRPNGSKFIVKNPDNGFAMTTSAFGCPLCIAKIHFHDGEVAETYRYLDFEMAPVFGEAYNG